MRILFCIALVILPCAGQVWIQQQKLASPGGAPVSVDGATAIVGSNIFVRSGTTWTLQQTLPVLGSSVSLSGNTAAVGVSGPGSSHGSVYIFVRNGTTWAQQQVLTASDMAAGDAFGASVSINGETLAVGAPGHSGGGAAYVFVRNGTTWTQQQEFSGGTNPASYSGFGTAVSVNADTLAVSSPGEYLNSSGFGVVFVFVRNLTTWSLQQELYSGSYECGCSYGSSLSVSGATLVVGFPDYPGGVPGAFVYVRSGGNWAHTQVLSVSDSAFATSVGNVSIDGDTIVESAYRFTNQASAYIFTRTAGAGPFSEQQEVVPSDVMSGYSITATAVSQGTVFLSLQGAPQTNDAAYVFAPSPAATTLSAVSVGPNTGGGPGPLTFLPLYTDPQGVSDIQVVYFDIGTSIFAPDSCIVLYIPSTNEVYLYNDSNTALAGGFNPSNRTYIHNSQCTLFAGGGANLHGTNLNIPFDLAFAGNFAGTKQMWGLVQSYSGAQSGWQLLGSWVPNQPPPPPPPPPLAAVSLSPVNGAGAGPQTFKALYTDPNGFNDLQVVYLDFGGSIFAPRSCIVAYVQASNQLFLYNDAATGSVPGSITEGSSNALSNSQCTISGSGGATVPNGYNLTVPFNITFLPGFGGTKNVWGLAQSYSGMQSSWQLFGNWATGLQASSVMPNSGSGFGPQTFSAVYLDPKGAADLQVVYLDFGSSILTANSCIVAYVAGNNSLYLFNDGNNGTTGPITEGSSNTLSNSQCTISGSGGTTTVGGLNLTVPISITFANSFTGSKNIWGLAQSYSGAQSGWQMLGTWTP